MAIRKNPEVLIFTFLQFNNMPCCYNKHIIFKSYKKSRPKSPWTIWIA